MFTTEVMSKMNLRSILVGYSRNKFHLLIQTKLISAANTTAFETSFTII